ncbi:GNAT family N-acetyltransferase [Roseobacter ponti]|uniref:N-acetyltransferase n=1 Tax=Roseobacter ponti TaxID=1891787 RepID=A0A858SRG4_9RHOB|nr:GNAT family N-acetyltransferase [Roseobacter ponti]QJF50478.1 N-acetyltransferase [Roseobacter ponti]
MIRPAAPPDAADVATLWNRMIRETDFTFTTEERSVANVRNLIRERDGAFFVAGTGGAFSGFVTFGAFRSGPGYRATAELSILVTPQAAGTGLAGALMQTGEEAARAAGIHVMIAAISAVNPRAIRFHTRQGYVEAGRLAEVGRKNGAWLDLVLMQKILAGGR